MARIPIISGAQLKNCISCNFCIMSLFYFIFLNLVLGRKGDGSCYDA
jgi:hypothetical protein